MYTKYTGIILKKYPLGEADELLTIYTREAGKLRAKAIGSRKIRSRLGGNLQSVNEIEFEVARSSASGGRLPVIISVRARTVNNYLRENLKKFAQALVGIETLYRLTPDEEKNEKLYQALLDFLKNLGQSPDGEKNLEVRKFQLAILEACGYKFPYGPINGRATEEKPINGRATEEKPINGQTTNKKGSAPIPDRSRGQVYRLTPELEKQIDEFLNYVLEREIKSRGFLRTLNQEL